MPINHDIHFKYFTIFLSIYLNKAEINGKKGAQSNVICGIDWILI